MSRAASDVCDTRPSRCESEDPARTGVSRLWRIFRLSRFPREASPFGKGENGRLMPSQPDAERRSDGSIPVTISNMIVGLLREYTGRGPTKARTTIRDNVVVVMLEQTLTKGEQVLVDKGRGENVLVLRQEYQEAMRDESSAKVAEITGQPVIAMMSANHIDPDLAAEIYVLQARPTQDASSTSAPGAT